MTFTDDARLQAIAWKQDTSTLPDEARLPGGAHEPGAPIRLPAEYAALNLLPDARDTALDRFARLGIQWHQGIGAGPSDHLLSSQVQCVNALAPFVARPDALRQIFEPVLDIAELLPFPDPALSRDDIHDHVAFEWLDLDHFGERVGRLETRGANATSADAAIVYRTPAGDTEAALIEWKFTESYRLTPLSGGDHSKATRLGRYESAFVAADGPLRQDRIVIDDLLVEPFYQLMRLHLLARSIERTGSLGARKVHVVYAAPAANAALWGSLDSRHRGDPMSPAGDLATAWVALLRDPSRFRWLDTASLIEPTAPTSQEFRDRYSVLARSPSAGSPQPFGGLPADLGNARDRLAAAIGLARSVLMRMAADGGVLSQLAKSDLSETVPPAQALELAARLEEIAELVRRVRADEIADLLHPPA